MSRSRKPTFAVHDIDVVARWLQTRYRDNGTEESTEALAELVRVPADDGIAVILATDGRRHPPRLSEGVELSAPLVRAALKSLREKEKHVNSWVIDRRSNPGRRTRSSRNRPRFATN